ncbi:uncharacterized protein LOC121740457 [Aricia agestis]|uniref:uncharacterized protein LOC121740457 n=1 Tax=Aricia agestis TaxID=91739 RepID=UPI001C202B7F|nr:uncharacterized protein LOC121740457 [Aricia agestis]
MTSLKESELQDDKGRRRDSKDVTELPPIGSSLHKRRRGEPPATLSVKSPQTPSDAEGSSPCTAGPTPEDWTRDGDNRDAEAFCDNMLQRLKDRNDALSLRGKLVATQTKETLEAVDHMEKLLKLLDQVITLEDKNSRFIKRLQQIHLARLHIARRKMIEENERLKDETNEIDLINEALDTQLDGEYGQAFFDSMLSGHKGVKRTTSRWKTHSRFGGSLLRRQRSRSAGGEDSDASPGTPLRRKSDGIFCKEVEKSKVSNWKKVKFAFKWEKAQWSTTLGGAAAVAAGAMVGAVALAGSNPAGNQVNQAGNQASPTGNLANQEPRDSASLTTGSALSLTPNSSCEELRIDSGVCRRSGHDTENIFLRAPTQDDSSTSPSPNKLHKSPWGKMRDIIQTHRDSVKKKTKGSKSPDVPARRRSFSDGGDSDAPPELTLTIPSSEELESEGSHPALRKQHSLDRPQHRPLRDSKWTRVKRAFLTSASASVPSSPNRHSAFFTDGDTEGLSSGCEAGGAGGVREEIARDYAALQSRLGKEFSDRSGKLSISHSLYSSSRPVATEEQLSADFRKKLEEWQRMKGVRQPPPVPKRQDLSEDFLKKWDDWTRMKQTNSVPPWEGDTKPDEVLVQTSTGIMKFKGISRSFTRKLQEWEKNQRIAPEASTVALLQAARAKAKQPSAPLTRTQSDGSVAPSLGRRHASSLSVNDADDFDSEYERDQSLEYNDEPARSAVLVEVEAEEVCTAAPLMAVSPRHMPQTPVYTYGPAEARLLCETSSAITGTAVLQPNGDGKKFTQKKKTETKTKTHEQEKSIKEHRIKLLRQPSLEEDAKFIRKAIEEIEKGSTHRYHEKFTVEEKKSDEVQNLPSTSKSSSSNLVQDNVKELKTNKEYNEDRKEDKGNGKKKSKSRARLEREQSKPSESDTEPEVDTVTVEIPRRKKRPRKPSEKPRTPPASLHSDTEGEVYVLKIKTPDQRGVSPEVIVKTTRKIFSPVVRSGESIPRAVIPVNVEDLDNVSPSPTPHKNENPNPIQQSQKEDTENKFKGSGDLQDDEQRSKSRPPLPSSPSSQRKPSPKETSPSIRIMIQRYNKKINEEGPVSGISSGAASPPWRSPKSDRRRPPDMPVGVNIRSNPFLEKEVQKSASACQLSRRERNSSEKSIPPSTLAIDGVLKSHSANALHPDKSEPPRQEDMQAGASTDTIVPRNLDQEEPKPVEQPPILRQQSEVLPPLTRSATDGVAFDRSVSVDPHINSLQTDQLMARLSERAAKIREARERFLFSTQMRRDGTSSASDLRPGDRSSRVSCDSDVTAGAARQQVRLCRTASNLGRSLSTGMVNVERDTWQRVAEGQRKDRTKSRFSLGRLAAKIRRKEESTVTKLCRQTLTVQLRK